MVQSATLRGSALGLYSRGHCIHFTASRSPIMRIHLQSVSEIEIRSWIVYLLHKYKYLSTNQIKCVITVRCTPCSSPRQLMKPCVEVLEIRIFSESLNKVRPGQTIERPVLLYHKLVVVCVWSIFLFISNKSQYPYSFRCQNKEYFKNTKRFMNNKYNKIRCIIVCFYFFM